MLYTAVLLACLVSAPADCRTHEMVISTPSPVTAFVEAQARAAEWLAARPGLKQVSLIIRAGRPA